MSRLYSVDLLKFFCAALVVLLHCQWKYRDTFLPLTRCAVPCFYIISGYLLYNNGHIGSNRIKRNIINVVKITINATLLYILCTLGVSIAKGDGIELPTMSMMIAWVVFNDCPFGFHLWYLYAYIYVLLIVWLFEKKQKINYLFYMIPILLAFDVLFGKYGMLLWGIDLPVSYLRNFLFVGLPYFSMGMFLKEEEPRLTINRITLLGGVILFVFTSYFERGILASLNLVASRDHYLSTTFLSVCLFLLVKSFEIKKENCITKLGKTDSLYIYILHPIILSLCSYLVIRAGISALYKNLAPIICLILTMITIIALRRLRIIK